MNKIKMLSLCISLILSCNVYAQTNKFNASKWRLNFSGGLGYVTAGTAADESILKAMGFEEKKAEDFCKDLKNGLQGSADMHYFLNKNIGFGLKYAFFTTAGEIEIGRTYSPGPGFIQSDMVLLKEVDYVHFVGPSVHTRSFIEDSRLAFSLTLSGGYAYLFGKSEYEVLPGNGLRGLATGHALGVMGGIGLEYLLNKHIALGFDVGYAYLLFNNLDVETSVKWGTNPGIISIEPEPFDLSQLDFSIGLKVYF
ncbi:MAG: outer membrane beta-barrel protein [Bacteroidales bacterium]|jgi:outer membrane protein W|nr:outer membrane beta-barrel protein [Bacteroidales bacterium]